MERMTTKYCGENALKGYAEMGCDDICDNNYGCEDCVIQKAFDKLAHYEDLEEQGLLKTVIRGEWKSECGLFLPVCRCSECNFVNLGQTKFCPNCGADMRKKEMEGK